MSENIYKNSDPMISNERHLIYAYEFKDFIKKNPGVIESVHNILKEHNDKDFVEVGDIKITKIKLSTIPVFKIEINNNIYFVKINHLPNSVIGEKGFNEFNSTEYAKELIKDIPWAEIAENQLGYKDDKYAYYVSKWNELLYSSNLGEHIEELEDYVENNPNNSQKEKKEISEWKNKVLILREKLVGFHDLFEHNMAYDPSSKKLYLFDLQTWGKVMPKTKN